MDMKSMLTSIYKFLVTAGEIIREIKQHQNTRPYYYY